MSVETLTEKQLLPEKFEPLRNNRWVFQTRCVDAFLVRSVEGPVLVPGAKTAPMKIALHNVMGVNSNDVILAWMNSKESHPVVIKHLDPVGTVVDLWQFDAKVSKVSFSKLDYADGGLLTTYVDLEVENFKFGFTD